MTADNFFSVVSVRLKEDPPLLSDYPIDSPEDAVNLIGHELSKMDREVFAVINLRTDGKPINCSFVSIGVLDQTLAHPREILKSSILSNAASCILVHNHPSGKLTPSQDDTKTTKRMIEVGRLLGIPLLDHIIVGANSDEYFSFRSKGLMEFKKKEKETYDYRELTFDDVPLTAESAISQIRHRHR